MIYNYATRQFIAHAINNDLDDETTKILWDLNPLFIPKAGYGHVYPRPLIRHIKNKLTEDNSMTNVIYESFIVTEDIHTRKLIVEARGHGH